METKKQLDTKTLDNPIFKNYHKARVALAKAKALADELQPEVIKELAKLNIKTGDTNFAKFTVTEKKTYEYPASVTKAQDGFAKIVTPAEEAYDKAVAPLKEKLQKTIDGATVEFNVDGLQKLAIKNGEAKVVDSKKGLSYKAL